MVRRFFTFVIPLACINYFPASRSWAPDPLGTPLVLQWLAPLAGPLFLLSPAVWKFGVRHYQSTGS